MRLLIAICAAMLFGAPAFAQPTAVNNESANGRPVIEREDQPDIINYERGDGLMNAAIAEARSKLAYFWERLAQPARNESDFTLKVGFPVTSDDVTTEHIWVEEIRRDGATLTARLANEPNWMTGKKLGDPVTFTEQMISDWGLTQRRKMIGFYTMRVMLSDMPQDEREAFEAMLGENPQ